MKFQVRGDGRNRSLPSRHGLAFLAFCWRLIGPPALLGILVSAGSQQGIQFLSQKWYGQPAGCEPAPVRLRRAAEHSRRQQSLFFH